MFGIGLPELMIILVVALLVVGPKKLPDLAKSLGKGLSEFRRATDEIKSELSDNQTYQDIQGIKDSFQETVESVKPQALLDTPPSKKDQADKPEPAEVKTQPVEDSLDKTAKEFLESGSSDEPDESDKADKTNV
ncbi:twin-arginine translocase TatA/TatE family subunit [Dethiosulfatarculus sandiegensis]|uniref:Sec-independent protein translocase protein TatA n=1 Tax=Dethiosulfatarculus sandiegensis TaxID=1429043 RepID=A0A0D2JAQ2_9BACT|nr:twin-arginine translocase TatA/TatE family subunit [Dethiosulfatarculus sandiegensis]KIX12811.1 primosome subunit DnaD [Dethiosulfatarculus sandiegensis]